ncbi:MAG: hypothetical protein GX357_09110 [Firmicutes bacterium]|nr:hypothetical protein [Bacillota bacterium]
MYKRKAPELKAVLTAAIQKRQNFVTGGGRNFAALRELINNKREIITRRVE